MINLNTCCLTVTNTGSASNRRPGFYLTGQWLPEMGFIPGALVQAVPEQDGFVFILCDENIRKYSELDAVTRDKGGKLIQVFSANIKGKECTVLMTNGQYLHTAGLEFGDRLAAVYEHGIIRVRKLPGVSKVVRMTSIKDLGRPIPKLRISGEWLSALGFTTGTPVTALAEPGLVTFELRDESVDKYSELVRFARQNKMKLLQVRDSPTRKRLYPYIMLTGTCIYKTGFAIGEKLVAFGEHGLIRLQKLELDSFGF